MQRRNIFRVNLNQFTTVNALATTTKPSKRSTTIDNSLLVQPLSRIEVELKSQTLDVRRSNQEQSWFAQKKKLASMTAMFRESESQTPNQLFKNEQISRGSKSPFQFSAQRHALHQRLDKSLDVDRMRKSIQYSSRREPAVVQNNYTINIQNMENVMVGVKQTKVAPLTQQQPARRPSSRNMQSNNGFNHPERIVVDLPRRSVSVNQEVQTQVVERETIIQPTTTFNPIYKIICSYRTRQGYLASNPEKTNQDAYQICQNFGGRGQHLFFVCDGHGSNGHHVSQYMKVNYPKILMEAIQRDSRFEGAMKQATQTLNKQLEQSSINCNLSGSTFIQFMFETCTGRITCGNVGDSRAIVGSLREGIWSAKPLSQDHKPNLPGELKRIEARGGRVDCYRDQQGRAMGPMRVWLKTERIPGLAMSRSIGDFVAASVGVSAEPEICELVIDESDKFIVMASDGVWEFMSNEVVVQTIAPFFEQRDINGACDALMKRARSLWTQDDCSVVDDITFIMIFVDRILKCV